MNLPIDLSFPYLLAIVTIFSTWFFYPLIFKLIGKDTLNTQLIDVRRSWLKKITTMPRNAVDAILLGHIINSVAFFGSATLIVMAALFSVLLNLEVAFTSLTNLRFIPSISFELFSVIFALLTLVMNFSFFSIIYALRKLVYSIALIGALPDATKDGQYTESVDKQVLNTAMVITEALKTFNFGIRGYYYAIATLCILISPWFAFAVATVLTSLLVYRQLKTTTAKSIGAYVDQQYR